MPCAKTPGTGLRIGDCVALRKDHVDGDQRFLRTGKSGESGYLPLPGAVTDALGTMGPCAEDVFWSGRGLRKSAVANWQRTLQRVFSGCERHRGMPIWSGARSKPISSPAACPLSDVAILLGHATPAVTAKYDSHFAKVQRKKLEARVREM